MAGIWAASLPGFLAAQEPSPSPLKNSTEVSVVSTNGNSKATTTSAKTRFRYDWTRLSAELFGSALGSQTRGDTTAEQYSAGQKVSYHMTPRDYLYELFKWDRDRFAGIADRYDISSGYGRKIIDTPADRLSGELGAGYINEDRLTAPRNDFASGRAYSKYEHSFSETSVFSQSVEYLHSFDDIDDFRLNTETALTAAITKIAALKTTFTWNRVAKPAPGAVKDDTKVMVGFLVSYGGGA